MDPVAATLLTLLATAIFTILSVGDLKIRYVRRPPTKQ